MDWSKAKNILIVAFIITNIFLIYHIERDMLDKDALEARSEGKIKEIVNILEERNIKVTTDVPIEVMALPVLDVEYTTYDLEKMKILFGDEAEVSLVMNDKVLKLKRTLSPTTNLTLTEKQARQEAERFLKKYGFKGNDVIYWSSNQSGNQYKILFKQSYKGRILENSYIFLNVTDAGVVEFERMWFQPLKYGANKIEIIPSPKALLKFMEENEFIEEDITITDIDLVYWLDVSQNSFTSWENVESGTAIPTWRIELNSGEVSLVPAFDDY